MTFPAFAGFIAGSATGGVARSSLRTVGFDISGSLGPSCNTVEWIHSTNGSGNRNSVRLRRLRDWYESIDRYFHL